MRAEYLFENLWHKALNDWPQTMKPTLQILEATRLDTGRAFIVQELSDLDDKVCSPYHDDKFYEALMVNLHWSICIALKGVSGFLSIVHLQDLRSELIRIRFEDDLRSTLADFPDKTGFTQEDINVMKDYFAVNYPDEPLP